MLPETIRLPKNLVRKVESSHSIIITIAYLSSCPTLAWAFLLQIFEKHRGQPGLNFRIAVLYFHENYKIYKFVIENCGWKAIIGFLTDEKAILYLGLLPQTMKLKEN